MTEAALAGLKRIREALQSSEMPELPPVLSLAPDEAPSSQDRVQRFRSEFEALGGRFFWEPGSDTAEDRLSKLLRDGELRRVACFDVPWLTSLVRGAGVEPFEKDLSVCDVSITTAHMLVAEQGLVVMAASPWGPRAASSLPPVHIVVAQFAQLVWGLGDALARIGEVIEDGEMPSDIVLIAGPSRTADIEKTLVIPAHGPRELCVVLIGEAGTAGAGEEPA